MVESLRGRARTILPSAATWRIVQKYGSRPRHIDTAACAARGIKVLTIRRRANIACAEVAFTLMLTLAKKLQRVINRISVEQLARARLRLQAVRPPPHAEFQLGAHHRPAHAQRDRRIGIIGLGEIGREIAIRAAAFGMRILYFQRTRMSEAEERELQVTYVPLATLLAQSDWVVPQLPERAGDQGLHRPRATRADEAGACLVNVSRADMVDRAALIEALKIGTARRLRARSALRGARPQRRRAVEVRQCRDLAAHRGAAALQCAQRPRRHDGTSVERAAEQKR